MYKGRRILRGVLDEAARAGLLAFVDGCCIEQGCDDTLRFTWQWAARQRFAPAAVSRLLAELDRVRCDCDLVVKLGRHGAPPDDEEEGTG